jgi:ribosomal subunit interface protein
MKLIVACRNESIGEAARLYAEEKAGRLSRYFDRLGKIEVVMDGGKDHRFWAELVVHAPRNHVFVCRAEGASATAAFDEALDKMERQLGKLKERLREHGGKETQRATRRLERRREAAAAPGRDETGIAS